MFPDGARRWRLAYRMARNQKTLSIGVYPEVSLAYAREARSAARKLLARGLDPSDVKRSDKAAKAAVAVDTFDSIAREPVLKKHREGRSETTLTKVEWLLALASPSLGARPVAEIKHAEVLATLGTVAARGRHETARRLRANLGGSVPLSDGDGAGRD